MPRTSPCASAGFTLVEMMMAMLIMTVGLLGLLQSIEVAYRQTARVRIREEALLVAEQQMNDFKRLRFEAITAAHSFTSTGSTGTRFQVTRKFEEIHGTPPKEGDALKLTVTVAWAFQNVTAQKHEIYTFKAR